MATAIEPGEGDVLLIVDVQNDFCPSGALGVAGGDAVVPVVNRLARAFRHVALTQDWHPPGHASFASAHDGQAPFDTIEMPQGAQTLWPDHCVQGTHRAEFHAGLYVPGVALIIRKGYHAGIDSYSAFRENDRTTPTGLTGYLRERGAGPVFLTGLATDFCVHYSAMDARREGFETHVILVGCGAIGLDGSLDTALADMRPAGVTLIAETDLAPVA